MEIKELRSLSAEDLTGKVKQWKDDLFRARFKAFSSESKDTSVFKKLKKDVARAYTVLTEKKHGVVVQAKASNPVAKQAAPAADKPAEPKAKKATAKVTKPAAKKKSKE